MDKRGVICLDYLKIATSTNGYYLVYDMELLAQLLEAETVPTMKPAEDLHDLVVIEVVNANDADNVVVRILIHSV